MNKKVTTILLVLLLGIAVPIVAWKNVKQYSKSAVQQLKNTLATYPGFKGQFWQIVANEDEQSGQLELVSPAFDVTKVFMPMTSPPEQVFFRFNETNESLYWITGLTTKMLDNKGEERSSLSEYLSHIRLNFPVSNHIKNYQLTNRNYIDGTMFGMLSQGNYLLNLPEGYGIPMQGDYSMSASLLFKNTNQNKLKQTVYNKTILNYTTKKLKPLFQQAVYIIPTVKDVQESGPEKKYCQAVLGSQSGTFMLEDGSIRTGHWVLPPGEEVRKQKVSSQLFKLPFSTTLHYISVKLHPFAESFELRNKTLDSMIFTATVVNDSTLNQVDHITQWSSQEGIYIDKNHEYELILKSNNTSNTTADMMAVMLLYFYDKELDEKLKQTSTIS